MGLDIAIRRVSKPRLEEGKLYNIDELNGICLRDEDRDELIYSQLLPYTLPADVRMGHYDIQKIIKDYGLASNSFVSVYSDAGIRVSEPYGHKKWIFRGMMSAASISTQQLKLAISATVKISEVGEMTLKFRIGSTRT